jgi:hypothetical protein
MIRPWKKVKEETGRDNQYRLAKLAHFVWRFFTPVSSLLSAAQCIGRFNKLIQLNSSGINI